MFNDMAFQLYVAEKEGWLDTRDSRINKMKKLIEEGYPVEKAANITNIDIQSLTLRERQELRLN